ncbi:MAG: hypothetical protein U5L96_00310 [Owenweeksia sp.]|nr:hypothetical protein [Owenweeksia sp.]
MKNTAAFYTPFSEIAVVGGTPYDSGKGANHLWRHGIRSQAIGISPRPSQENELYQNPHLVKQKFDEKAGDDDFSEIIIYCNSLSFIANWRQLYPGRIYELSAYYRSILEEADLPKLAIIVAEENTQLNLKRMVMRDDICDPEDLHIFPRLQLISDLEASTEDQHYHLLKSTLKEYMNQGYTEILLGCTHLDHPDFASIPGLVVHQPGLQMLEEFIAEYNEHTAGK